MNLKKIAKIVLTRLNCLINHISYKKGMDFGYGVKVVGPGKTIIESNVKIRPLDMVVTLSKNAVVKISSGCDIGQFSRIGCVGNIILEENVLTGPNVFIADYNHEFRDITKPVIKLGNNFIPKTDGSPNIIIGEGSWLAINVVVVGNVHIGKHCVIGANSVVTKDIPDYSIAVGSPCKVIKRYNRNTQRWERVN